MVSHDAKLLEAIDAKVCEFDPFFANNNGRREKRYAIYRTMIAVVRQAEGWRMVPVEPTWQMCAAGGMEHSRMVKTDTADADDPDLRFIWAAMLAAAPEAP